VIGALPGGRVRLRRLTAGDRVAFVAPASGASRDEVENAAATLETLGLRAAFDESVFLKDRFTAGSAAARAESIHRALRDPDVAGLIAIRGGYGSAQVLPLLDADLVRAARKPLIGYSDITALLCFYLQHGLTAIHGPMADRRLSRGSEGFDVDSFRRVVMSDAPAGELRPPQLEPLHGGTATGVLAGGTLTQLMASMGTPWAFRPPEGAILFIEDIGERPYRIHRLLTQAAQAGVFAQARAIVLGEFPNCHEPGGEPSIKDVLREFTADLKLPVLFNFPSGHTGGPTWTLPLGVTAEIVAGPSPVVRILEAAVE
jgi:muramoyltetrapeptide carboxypeptidase